MKAHSIQHSAKFIMTATRTRRGRAKLLTLLGPEYCPRTDGSVGLLKPCVEPVKIRLLLRTANSLSHVYTHAPFMQEEESKTGFKLKENVDEQD